MGTWGAGNFDSDEALEFLDLIQDDLVRMLRTWMTPNRQANYHWFYDYYGAKKLIPAIDLLVTITTHYNSTLEDLINPNEVDDWRDMYLYIYDKIITDFTSDSDYIVKHRKQIEETFARLRQLTEN